MTRALSVAVQMDPIETVNIDADSSFALMLAAQARGHALWHYEVRHLRLSEGVQKPGTRRGERLRAIARPITVRREPGRHFAFGAPSRGPSRRPASHPAESGSPSS